MIFGSIPALVTPFSGNCVAEDSLREFVEWQIAEGSDALVPCGMLALRGAGPGECSRGSGGHTSVN